MINTIYKTGKIYPVTENVRENNTLVELGSPVIFISFNENTNEDTFERSALVKDFKGNKFNMPIPYLSENEISEYPNKFKILKSKMAREIYYKSKFYAILCEIFAAISVSILVLNGFFELIEQCTPFLNSTSSIVLILNSIFFFITGIYIDNALEPNDDTWTFSDKDNLFELESLLKNSKYEIKDKEGNLIDVAISTDSGIVSSVPLDNGSYIVNEI